MKLLKSSVFIALLMTGLSSSLSSASSLAVINPPSGVTFQLLTKVSGLSQPQGVAVDKSDNLYISNTNAGTVIKLVGGNATVIASGLAQPMGLAVDDAGNVFVAEAVANDVVEIPQNGDPLLTVLKNLNSPRDVEVDQFGNLFVADDLNGRIVKRAADGTVSVIWNGGGCPTGVAVAPSGTVITTLQCTKEIVEITPSGEISKFTNNFGDNRGVTVDGSRNIFVLDAGRNQVDKLDNSGNFSKVFSGNLGLYGAATDGIAVNSLGDLFIDGNSSSVLELESTPTASVDNSGLALVAWNPPLGSTGVIDYTVSAFDSKNPNEGGQTCNATSPITSCTIANLIGGESYTFSVTARSGTLLSNSSHSTQAVDIPMAARVGPPTNVLVTPSANRSLLIAWSPPSGASEFPITSYTATATPGGGTCTTAMTTCAISNLDLSTSYSVQVIATTSKGSSIPSAPSLSLYPITATTLKVKTIPFVVQPKAPFTVLAYGAPAGKLVTLGVPGSQNSCTTSTSGQCTVTLSVKSAGSWTVLAVDGKSSASNSFYAPSIKMPLGAKHGKSFTVAIAHAPAKAAILLTLSDGRTRLATTNTAGSVSISVAALKQGFLTVTPSIAAIKFPASTVLVG